MSWSIGAYWHQKAMIEARMATGDDEAELVKRYGKTSDELADEAERGYDVSKLIDAPQRRPLCPAYCASHRFSCNIGFDDHPVAHGQQLHACSFGQWGHDFYWTPPS